MNFERLLFEMIRVRTALENLSPYPVSTTPRSKQICLDMNENPRGPSPRVKEELSRLEPETLFAYPDYHELYLELANEVGVRPENLILTCGGDEAIRVILEALVEKNKDVVLTTPTYSMYRLFLNLRQARPGEIKYGPDLTFPLDQVLAQSTEPPAALILVNPASPTGEIITLETITRILQNFPQTPVIIDETYHHYSGVSAVPLLEEFPNLILIRTFSKAYGLAGLRLGYIIGSTSIIEKLHLINPPYPLSGPAVVAARAALSDQEFIEKEKEFVEQEKVFLQKALARLHIETRTTATNFILIKVGPGAAAVQKALARENIRVRSLENYPPLEEYLRISIGTRKDHEQLLQALEKVLSPSVLLFDLDGVLVDVRSSYREAIAATVKFFSGQRPDQEEIAAAKRAGGFNNDWDLTAALLERRKIDIPRSRIIEKFQEFYLGQDWNGLIQKEKPLINRELLGKLSRKFKLGIVTGRPRSEAFFTLEHLGLKDFFSPIITMDDLPPEKGKPDPAGLELALEKMGSSRGYYIGDTPDDMEAARRAGLIPLGFMPPGNTLSDREALQKAGAHRIIESIMELEEVLECDREL